jgi:hypothetical protein
MHKNNCMQFMILLPLAIEKYIFTFCTPTKFYIFIILLKQSLVSCSIQTYFGKVYSYTKY